MAHLRIENSTFGANLNMDKSNCSRQVNPPGFLRGIGGEDCTRILASGKTKSFRPGEILFHNGDKARNCYLVLSGNLKLTQYTKQGKGVTIRYIGPSEMTALVTVLKGKQYPATAKALKQTKVIIWDRHAMLQLMQEYPDIAINMLRTVMERLGDIQHRYVELSSEMVEQRIARTLMRLAQQSGKTIKEGVCIDIPLSRQNIADYCGTTLYTVSRMLNGWEKHGWVQSKREHVTITAPNAIGSIAGHKRYSWSLLNL